MGLGGALVGKVVKIAEPGGNQWQGVDEPSFHVDPLRNSAGSLWNNARFSVAKMSTDKIFLGCREHEINQEEDLGRRTPVRAREGGC